MKGTGAGSPITCACAAWPSPAFPAPASAPCTTQTHHSAAYMCRVCPWAVAQVPAAPYSSNTYVSSRRCSWPRCRLRRDTARSASSSRAASLPPLAPPLLGPLLLKPLAPPASSARLAASSVRASCAVSLKPQNAGALSPDHSGPQVRELIYNCDTTGRSLLELGLHGGLLLAGPQKVLLHAQVILLIHLHREQCNKNICSMGTNDQVYSRVQHTAFASDGRCTPSRTYRSTRCQQT